MGPGAKTVIDNQGTFSTDRGTLALGAQPTPVSVRKEPSHLPFLPSEKKKPARACQPYTRANTKHAVIEQKYSRERINKDKLKWNGRLKVEALEYSD